MIDKINQPQEVILSKIYDTKAIKVMLDRDMAELYDVKDIRLPEHVKRNSKKFPEHFMFQLDWKEGREMESQNALTSNQHPGGKLPYVFTEHGVLQLAIALQRERAVQMSIKIIEVFLKTSDILLTRMDQLIEMEKIQKQ